MDFFCRFYRTFNIGMALKAEPGNLRGKEFFDRGPVRIMAGSAAALQRRVHDFLLDFRLHVDMAGEAQAGALLNEQTRIVRLMRVMAGRAVARRRGTVDVLEVYLVGMT